MPNILLVDDDPQFRKMLRLILENLGHTVTEAEGGKQALALYQEGVHHLVLIDLLMPEKEGLETIQELKRIDPASTIIAMSGGGRNSVVNILNVARHFGASAILSKPFNIDALKSAITMALH